jgi:hypothetical protein
VPALVLPAPLRVSLSLSLSLSLSFSAELLATYADNILNKGGIKLSEKALLVRRRRCLFFLLTLLVLIVHSPVASSAHLTRACGSCCAVQTTLDNLVRLFSYLIDKDMFSGKLRSRPLMPASAFCFSHAQRIGISCNLSRDAPAAPFRSA